MRRAIGISCALTFFIFIQSLPQTRSETPATNSHPARRPTVEILGEAGWRNVEHSVEKGLDYLAAQQRADGSFEAPPTGQPGITSLCVLAFLSRGHLREQGPYGRRLTKAIDFVLSCQRKDGLLSYVEPEPQHVHDGASHAGNYNHAIAGLMLGEVYGMCRGDQHERIKKSIERGIVFMRSQQLKPKRQAIDKGGVRYIRPRTTIDADLSVTSWQLTFMRSARNAEFDVPKEYVDDAMQFVRGCYDTRIKTFIYGHSTRDHMPTWGVAGGGIISLELGADHGTEMARNAGTWLLSQTIDRYNRGGNGPYHYGLYYASQGMFQLGGEYWDKFYPRLAEALTKFQQNDGSWDIEQDYNGNGFGQTYTTALSVLALTPPYQLLPIYQR
jgi:hypothetical protein